MYKYILELKNRCILLLITWLSLIITAYFYKETLLYFFVENELFNNSNFKIYYFISTNILEVFSVYMQLILFLSLQIFFFYSLYHIFVFINSGLFITEYYYFRYVLTIISIVTFFSIIISKLILIPMMLNFFINFQNLDFINLYFEAKLSEYTSFFIKSYYFFILYSQTFTLLIFFFNYIILSFESIKKFRKIYYYFFFLFSTLVSPPDVFSQILISLTLICLYELFIFFFIFKKLINKLNR